MATSNEQILNIVRACYKEAEEAKRSRMRKNRENWEVFLGQQDWSHKNEDQSTEFLPKLSTAAEQMAATVKKGLVGFGDWFSVKAPSQSPISGTAIRDVLKYFLREINVGNCEYKDFSVIVSDATKAGLLESLIILKIHGGMVEENYFHAPMGESFVVEPDEPINDKRKVWKLRIDVVPADEYFPDPTGANLYRIHEIEKDYAEVLASAESGIYDLAVVKQIKEDYTLAGKPDRKRAAHKNQNESTKPQFRRKVVIREFWGTMIDEDGSVLERDVICAVANDKYVIRKPKPFPYWHGSHPFVEAPLIRVPGSTWHKAVYDHAASLNIALNEMYNLMLDGAMAAVWGVKQLRPDMLEDPSQVSNGIPPGTTLILAEGAASQQLAFESCITPSVPPDTFGLFQLTDTEFNSSAFTSELRRGNLPNRKTQATEIMASEQGNAVTFDGIIGDLEHEIIEKALKKIWMLVLQNADNMAPEEVVEAVGVDVAFALANLSPAQRFRIFAGYGFQVDGLSATIAKARDFQKLMAFMQVIGANPLLMQAFFMKYSPDRVLELLLKTLNINPTALTQLPEEEQAMQNRMKYLPQFMQQMGMNQNQGSQPVVGGGGSTMGMMGGDSGLNGEIHQNAEPTSGF